MAHGKCGIALAGGGPLGAIYEIGALVALDEALVGLDLAACDVYVGVSSGGFFAAGLANGMTPRELYRVFIETEAADNPFEPNACCCLRSANICAASLRRRTLRWRFAAISRGAADPRLFRILSETGALAANRNFRQFPPRRLAGGAFFGAGPDAMISANFAANCLWSRPISTPARPWLSVRPAGTTCRSPGRFRRVRLCRACFRRSIFAAATMWTAP